MENETYHRHEGWLKVTTSMAKLHAYNPETKTKGIISPLSTLLYIEMALMVDWSSRARNISRLVLAHSIGLTKADSVDPYLTELETVGMIVRTNRGNRKPARWRVRYVHGIGDNGAPILGDQPLEDPKRHLRAVGD
ncbi:hypothetical protein O5Y_21210 [Rhodococcus erythropolis CCM2595]|nr:hypothetical protein O5Y_21210 [Rhodococcus erythropolis CCM2595]SUE11579.1 Uncharacterised protein [Rhodococcus erythropolis]